MIYHWRDEKKIRNVATAARPEAAWCHCVTDAPSDNRSLPTQQKLSCDSTSSSIIALLSSSPSPVTCQCSPSRVILELGCEHLNQQQPRAASKRYKYFSDLLNIFTAAAPSPGPGLVSAARRGGRGSEVIKFDHPTIKHLLFKLRGSTAAELGAALPSTKLETEHWPRLFSTSWLFAALMLL